MIFLLSCMGNTRWAGAKIAQATGDKVVDVLRTKERRFVLGADERIGFCFPVHGWRPPLLLRRFISELTITRGEDVADTAGVRQDNVATASGAPGRPYVYAVMTAGDTCGEAVDMLRADLSRRGLSLDSSFSLLMPETYVGLPFMNVDTKVTERRKIAQAERQLEEFIPMIVARRSGEEHVVRGRWPRVNSRLLGALFIACLVTDKPFKVDAARCDGCGECRRRCPVGNIGWASGRPVWLHTGRCMSCFVCYHHCPHHAIEYGRRTRGKGQYRGVES